MGRIRDHELRLQPLYGAVSEEVASVWLVKKRTVEGILQYLGHKH